MAEVFVFRCRGCGRVAPHMFWRPRSRKSGSAPEVMMQFPSPECPQCGGINVDVNHGYADGAEGDAMLREFRQKLVGQLREGEGGGAGAGEGAGEREGTGAGAGPVR